MVNFWKSDKKIPLSTAEAGFIKCVDSFFILIQGVKDKCLLVIQINITLTEPSEKSKNGKLVRVEYLPVQMLQRRTSSLRFFY